MRNFTIAFCLFLVGGVLNAQSLLDKLPPSPTAASIIGASEISTSKFTGTPNISIPIHQIVYHNMSVPISLSYNAQGIKVNSVPGWVGTNWSLNAGGVITRMINGLPDESNSGYFAKHSSYIASGLVNADNMEKYDAGTLDGAPDMYNFSFPGGSGKFMIDHTKQIHVFPHQRLKVEFINSGNHIDLGFTITTLDGTVYTFSEVETTTIAASGSLTGGTYPSAWYLKSIHTPMFPNKRVILSYTQNLNLQEARKIKSYSASRRYYTGAFLNPAGVVTQEKSIAYNAVRLNKIEWGTFDNSTQSITDELGSVVFVATTTRADLTGEKMLDEIEIKDNLGVLLKEYKMTYSYYGLLTGGVSSSGKLRLDQIQEFDAIGGSNPPNVFSYDANPLPDYNNTGQDFWGYYNGNTSNADLLPKQRVDFSETQLSPPITIEGHYSIGSADRAPNETYLKYGILTSIKYPTGGTSNFEFEINEYSSEMIDNLGLQTSTLQGGASQATSGVGPGFVNGYDYIKNTFGSEELTSASSSIWSDAQTTANTQTTTFTTTAAQKIGFSFTLSSISGLSSYVKVERSVNGSWELIFDSSSFAVAITGNPNILFNNPVLLTKERPAGTYRLTSHANATTPPSGGSLIVENVRTQINADWYIPTGNTNLLGPGLRVRQISQKENALSAAVNIRKFEYVDENGASTGTLYASPIHSYRKYLEEESNPDVSGIDLLTPLIVQNSSSSFANYGADLGYSQVVELIGTSGENGKIIDEYRTNHLDIYSQVLAVNDYGPKQYPLAPSVYALWDAGDLLKSTIYRKKKTGEGGDDFKKVKETINTYAFQQGAEVKGVAVGKVIKGTTISLSNSLYSEVPFEYISVWNKLIKTEQTSYSNSEIGQTTTTEFTYETVPNHLQVKSQSLTGSDGRKTISEYTYPLDYGTAHPYASGLIANNMHGAVIEELNILEYGGTREVLGGKMIKYNGTALQPEEIFTLKVGSTLLEGGLYKSTSYNGSNSLMDGLYESRINFNYRNGNLIEQQQVGGSPMSYIWGYDNQYPVAQLQNATYADIEGLTDFTTGFDLGMIGLSGAQEIALRTLDGALVTTMTFKIGEGMKSQTTPNKLTSYYEYDTFKRLKYVKDKDQNILRKMEYTYGVNANTTNN